MAVEGKNLISKGRRSVPGILKSIWPLDSISPNPIAGWALGLPFIVNGCFKILHGCFVENFSIGIAFTILIASPGIVVGYFLIKRIFWPAVAFSSLSAFFQTLSFFLHTGSKNPDLKIQPSPGINPWLCWLVLAWFLSLHLKRFRPFRWMETALVLLFLGGALISASSDSRIVMESAKDWAAQRKSTAPAIPHDNVGSLAFRQTNGELLTLGSPNDCVLLDFSAEGCTACLYEGPILEKLSRELSQGMGFRLVVAFPPYQLKRPESVAKKFNLPRDVLVVDEQKYGDRLGVDSWPTKFVLHKNRLVPIKFRSGDPAECLASWKRQINQVCYGG